MPRQASLFGPGSPGRRYAAALLLVLAAFLLRYALNPILHGSLPYATFIVAVVISAFQGGVGPGLLATLLSWLLADYFFVAPRHSIGLTGAGLPLPAMFWVLSLLVIFFAERQRRAARALRESAEALRASETQASDRLAQLESIYATAPVGLCFVSAELRFVKVNDRMAEINGLPAQRHIGRTVREMMPDLASHVEPLLECVLETGEPIINFEIHGDTPARPGVIRDWLASYYPVRDKSGRLIGVNSVVQEVTERKQQDALLRHQAQMLDQAQDPVIGWEPGGRGIFLWNRAAEELYGFTADEARGRVTHDLLKTEFSRSLGEIEDTLLRNGEWAGELTHHTRDGRRLIVEAHMSLIRSGDGRRVILETVRDITARKRAEEQLRESERRFRSTFENAAVGIAHVALDGTWLIVNERLCEITGYTREELLARTFQDITHPDDLDADLGLARRLLAGEITSYAMEKRYLRKDGAAVWVNLTGSLVQDAAGGPQYCIAIVEDITTRKRAEQQQRESEENLRFTINAAEAGMYSWTSRTNQLRWSPRTYEILGYARGEEPSIEKWLARLHPEDRARAEWEITAALQGETKSDTQYRLLLPGGEVRWVQSYRRVFRQEDGATFLHGLLLDVTVRKLTEEQLRASEERLRLATEAAEMFAWECDLRGQKMQWSDNAAQLIGCASDELPTDMGGSNFFVAPEDAAQLAREYEEATRRGATAFKFEFRGRERGGRVKHWQAQGSILYDAAGAPVRILGVTQDITERKRIEAEREELLRREHAAREEAEAANRMKDEFLAVISHELRTPLSAILGWSRLANKGQLSDARRQQAMEVIERSATTQSRLVEDLLDASRIISGKLSVEAHLLDLAPVARAALEAVRPSAEGKSQSLHFINEAGALWVRGDAARLQQVVVNLLSNAVKFTPPDGEITITLSAVSRPPGTTDGATNGATPHATPAGFARLTVSDTGRGVSPGFLPFVFERFRQADTSTRRAVGGLGLGLAIVRYLVEMHGGTVWAASDGEGRGATFTVELPLARLPAQGEATKPGEVVPTSRPHFAVSPAELAGVRVLVVEDDADTRDVLTLVLNEAGAEVTVAASAAEGLQKLEAERPDVLLSDIGLPDQDGFDLIRQVRALPPERGGHTLAAALTAYARSEDRLRALAAGFHSHLVKPVEPAELILVVRSLAGRAGFEIEDLKI